MTNLSLSPGARSILIGMLLIGVYVGYSRLTAPWLEVKRTTEQQMGASAPTRSRETVEFADDWFPEDPWVRTAGKKNHHGQRHLFFNELQILNNRTTDGSGRAIELSPLALLWQHQADESPFTMTAASAIIELDGKNAFFDSAEGMREGELGKVKGLLIPGDVRIRGPDGLKIEGRNFHVSEESMKVWSNQPVRFVWQTHTGFAQNGVDIQLLPPQDSTRSGLTSIGGIHWVRFNGRVVCNLSIRDEHRPDRVTDLKIDAARSLKIEPQIGTATFLGDVEQELTRDNQILVTRPVQDADDDRLYCSQLQLRFQPELIAHAEADLDSRSARTPGLISPGHASLQHGPSDTPTITGIAADGPQDAKDSASEDHAAPAAPPRRRPRMQLHSIEADGKWVLFHSAAEDLLFEMTHLRYTPGENLLEMWDHNLSTNGRLSHVRLKQGTSQVLAPMVTAILDHKNQPKDITFRGPGSLSHTEDQSDQAIEISWLRSCEFRTGDNPRVTIDGDVRIRRLSDQLMMTGEWAEMLLHQQQETALRPGEQSFPAAVSGVTPSGIATAGYSSSLSPGSDSRPALDLGNLSPRTLTVRNNVVLNGLNLSGRASRELKVTFADQPFADHNSVRPGGVVAPTSLKRTPAELTSSDTTGFTDFSCESIEASIVMAEQDEKPQARLGNIWLNGKVVVDHTAVNSDQSFTAHGNFLFAEHGFDDGRNISLFGDPATVVSRVTGVEGPRIDLQEMQRRITVEGPGRLRLIVDRGMDGKPLPRPAPLDIYWGERMEFLGRTARFVGDIRAVMKDGDTQDTEVICAGMTVTFSRDVTLQNSDQEGAYKLQPAADKSADSEASDIARLETEGRVTLKIEKLDNGSPQAVHRAEFTNFSIDTQTGEFSATGPGWIESTQPDTGNKLKVAPAVVARSNTPVRTSEQAYMYVRASFIGTISGNVDGEFMRLQQHVSGVFGPVRRLGETVEVAEFTTAQLPDQAGILRCEELVVSAIPGSVRDEKSFSLLAKGNASLELRQLSGDADIISYDHAKEQFILRTEGDNLATVLHRVHGASDARRVDGKRFEYYPGLNELNAREIFRVRAAQ